MTPENIGNYQEKRAARRTERSKKMASKGKDTTKFDAKTAFIVEKAKKNKSNTNSKKQQDMADCIAAGGTYKNGVCS